MNDQFASTSATLFYVTALHSIGRTAEARDVFDHLLQVSSLVSVSVRACESKNKFKTFIHVQHASSPLGFLSENVALGTNELWGNFPYTPAMVCCSFFH